MSGTGKSGRILAAAPAIDNDKDRRLAQQPDLFTQEAYGGHCPHNHTATSAAAARRAGERGPTQRQRVHDFIISKGSSGATRDEISVALGIPIQSVCARVGELLNAENPLVRESQNERSTQWGEKATVLVGVLQ